jgi:hypothetical protein
VSCFVNVAYLRRVAGAICAPSRLARKTLVASARVMRSGDWGGGSGACVVVVVPSHVCEASQAAATALASSQSVLPVCFRLKCP